MQLNATIKLMVTIKQKQKRFVILNQCGEWRHGGGETRFTRCLFSTQILYDVLIGLQTSFKVVAFVIAQICKLDVEKKL